MRSGSGTPPAETGETHKSMVLSSVLKDRQWLSLTSSLLHCSASWLVGVDMEVFSKMFILQLRQDQCFKKSQSLEHSFGFSARGNNSSKLP